MRARFRLLHIARCELPKKLPDMGLCSTFSRALSRLCAILTDWRQVILFITLAPAIAVVLAAQVCVGALLVLGYLSKYAYLYCWLRTPVRLTATTPAASPYLLRHALAHIFWLVPRAKAYLLVYWLLSLVMPAPHPRDTLKARPSSPVGWPPASVANARLRLACSPLIAVVAWALFAWYPAGFYVGYSWLAIAITASLVNDIGRVFAPGVSQSLKGPACYMRYAVLNGVLNLGCLSIYQANRLTIEVAVSPHYSPHSLLLIEDLNQKVERILAESNGLITDDNDEISTAILSALDELYRELELLKAGAILRQDFFFGVGLLPPTQAAFKRLKGATSLLQCYSEHVGGFSALSVGCFNAQGRPHLSARLVTPDGKFAYVASVLTPNQMLAWTNLPGDASGMLARTHAGMLGARQAPEDAAINKPHSALTGGHGPSWRARVFKHAVSTTTARTWCELSGAQLGCIDIYEFKLNSYFFFIQSLDTRCLLYLKGPSLESSTLLVSEELMNDEVALFQGAGEAFGAFNFTNLDWIRANPEAYRAYLRLLRLSKPQDYSHLFEGTKCP